MFYSQVQILNPKDEEKKEDLKIQITRAKTTKSLLIRVDPDTPKQKSNTE